MLRKVIILGIVVLLILTFLPGSVFNSDNRTSGAEPVHTFLENTVKITSKDLDLTRGSRSQPKANFTYLYADGTSAVGSTAFRVDDGNLDIFIEAFPASGTYWDPDSVTKADIILQAPHGHMTHYDADTVANVAKNTSAYVVGNTMLKNDMTSRGISSDKIVELAPTLGNNVSTTVLGVKITAFKMMHAMTTDQIDTFLVELPNGIRFFHGTCASGASMNSYMKGHAEFYCLDAIMVDFDFDFAALNSEFRPEVIFKTHEMGMQTVTYWDNYPSGQETLTHNTTKQFTQPDYQPILKDASFTPDAGSNETTFNFMVNYSYRKNEAPTKSQIVIDGTPHDMTAPSVSGWWKGSHFKYSSPLDPGTHEYHFEFEAGTKSVRFPATGELTGPEVNAIPLLHSGKYNPLNGNTKTEFTFSVSYQDADEVAPSKKNVVIDGKSYPMTSTDSTVADGAEYTYKTTLGVGIHSYYFVFNDSVMDVRYPKAGELPVSNISRFNTAPILTQEAFSPASGNRDDKFTFSIKYVDAEGDAPIFAKIFIDGIEHALTKVTSDYISGVNFFYTTNLDLGTHTCYYEFNDSYVDVRAPSDTSLEFNGPEVQNRDPLGRIKEPKDQSDFTEEDNIKFDASSSTDPDKDDLTYSWSSSIDGYMGTGEVIWTKLSPGTHIINLTTTDLYNGTSIKSVEIYVIELVPILELELTMSPVIPTEGQTVTAKATVLNEGTAEAEGIKVAFYLNEDPLDEITINSLLELDDQEVTTTFKSTQGEHTLKAILPDGTEKSLDFVISERLKPIAVAGENINVKAGEVVDFDASKSTSMGYIVSYLWDFGDQTNESGKTATHTYYQKGTYTVTLTVIDELGKSSKDTISVTVRSVETPDEK
jgi:PKD repeat protein/L-ascorbate metabolism protein UlaG (beta-lactamase superfamily)